MRAQSIKRSGFDVKTNTNHLICIIVVGGWVQCQIAQQHETWFIWLEQKRKQKKNKTLMKLISVEEIEERAKMKETEEKNSRRFRNYWSLLGKHSGRAKHKNRFIVYGFLNTLCSATTTKKKTLKSSLYSISQCAQIQVSIFTFLSWFQITIWWLQV